MGGWWGWWGWVGGEVPTKGFAEDLQHPGLQMLPTHVGGLPHAQRQTQTPLQGFQITRYQGLLHHSKASHVENTYC